MAVGIKLYCWLILVHLFYNNKKQIYQPQVLCLCLQRQKSVEPTPAPPRAVGPAVSQSHGSHQCPARPGSAGNLRPGEPGDKLHVSCLYILKSFKCSGLLGVLQQIWYRSVWGCSVVLLWDVDSDVSLSCMFPLNSCSQHFPVGNCLIFLTFVLLSNLWQALRTV